MTQKLRIAEMLCTRLCHDLTGPIGAVNNGAEFLHEEGFNLQSQAVELITSSAFSAVARLQFYRVAYGRVKEQGEASLADHQKLATDFFTGSKITLDWPDQHADGAGVSLSLRMMRMLFNLLVIAGNALLKGGTITVRITPQGTDGKRLEVLAQGDAVKWDPEVESILKGTADAASITPKSVQVYITYQLAEELGVNFAFEPSDRQLKLVAVQAASENGAAAA